MPRIADLSSTTSLVNILQETQNRVYDYQIQVSTEQKSQDYAGIALETQRLIGLEHSKALAERYIRNNGVQETRLDYMQAGLTAMEKTIDSFKAALDNYAQNITKDENAVGVLQTAAYNSLKSLEADLNQKADGQYLFSGSRTDVTPVDFGLSSKAAFQAKWDGETVTYPTTRDAHLQDFSASANTSGDSTWLYFDGTNGRIYANDDSLDNLTAGATITVSGTGSNDGTYTISSVDAANDYIAVNTVSVATDANDAGVSITLPNASVLTAADFTDISFTYPDTLVSTTAGALSGLSVGDTFTISGANTGSNDGTYTVESNDGTTMTIRSLTLTNEGTGVGTEDAAGTIATNSYYSGDQVTRAHRIDEDRTFENDITAAYPAFEKAIRAMFIILQGEFGTAGGLDNNESRVDEANWLLAASKSEPVDGTPPYGTETIGNFIEAGMDVAHNIGLIKTANERFQSSIGFIDKHIIGIEKVDKTTAVTLLLDETRALEASYQAFAKVRSLSLVNFLS